VPPTPAYVLLGLLAVRSWTGYELSQQVSRSLSHVWPASAAHVYREQQRLVRLGWATVTAEAAGPERTRNRYTITRAGRRALREWLDTEPAPTSLESEGMLRAWFADSGTTAQLVAALEKTATDARASVDRVVEVFSVSLAGQGAFESRAHLNAIVGEFVADVFALVADRCAQLAEEVGRWPDTTAPGFDEVARARMNRVVEEHVRCAHR
jgi:DNA-binding PadR family transcriptional regulator